MNPQYMQSMIQALMGGSYNPNPMATGQNPTTAYGQSFMSGNTMRLPPTLQNYGMGSQQGSQQQGGTIPYNTPSSQSLGSNPVSMQLQQPTSTYTS